MPFLSIITVNRNNKKGLLKTILSVANQIFDDFEYIIIDGASTDGSTEIIKQYEAITSLWISEPDTGIYAAMNKGIAASTGEYLLFLNSGDWLIDNNVLIDIYNSNCTADIISGNIIIIDSYGNQSFHNAPNKDQLSFNTFYNSSLPHPATFIKRTLFHKHGFYNESYKIVADKEFFIRTLIMSDCSYEYFNRTITYFPLGGISSNSEFQELQKKESELVNSKITFPLVYKAYQSIQDENIQYKELFDKYRDYINLLNGKLAFIIKFILSAKLLIKKMKNPCSK
jgi:Glycosyltransferases involved in cell wall biogenesis